MHVAVKQPTQHTGRSHLEDDWQQEGPVERPKIIHSRLFSGAIFDMFTSGRMLRPWRACGGDLSECFPGFPFEVSMLVQLPQRQFLFKQLISRSTAWNRLTSANHTQTSCVSLLYPKWPQQDHNVDHKDSVQPANLVQGCSELVVKGDWENFSDFDLYQYWGNFTDGYFSNDSYDPCETSAVCSVQPCDASDNQRFQHVFIPTLYSVIFLVGLLGNGVVLLVLTRNLRTLAVTETYILHLALADLLLVVGMPFWAAEEAWGWSFGLATCKIVGATYNISFYSSIYLLVCISFDRYLSIVHAVQMYKRRQPWRVYLSCLLVWLICLLLSIPDFIYLMPIQSNGSSKCAHNYEADTSKTWIVAMRFFYHVTGFLGPLMVMAFCYLNIVVTLRQSHSAQRRKECRAIKVIAVVVLAFLVCWTPYNVVMFTETLHRLGVVGRDCGMESRLDTSYAVTSCLGNLHCCLNPFLYAFVGAKFRRQLLEALREAGCVSRDFVKRCSQPSRRQSVMAVSESGETSYSGF
ncbi:C-X-C chemokine receptor type 3-like [Mustelus asterias]